MGLSHQTLNEVGEVERYKTRLVCRGDQQRDGIDIAQTYESTLVMTTERILFALAAIHTSEQCQCHRAVDRLGIRVWFCTAPP